MANSNNLSEMAHTATNPVDNLISSTMEAIGNWTPKILGAIIALIVGLWIISLLTRIFKKAIERTNIDDTLIPFLTAVVNFALKIVLFLGIAELLGTLPHLPLF